MKFSIRKLKTFCYEYISTTSIGVFAGLVGFFGIPKAAFAQPWAMTGERVACGATASSADGRTLVAACGAVYLSTDAGASWTQSITPSDRLLSVGCSADGTKLVAAETFGDGGDGSSDRIYISRDTGATWTLAGAPTNNWISVACSADGAKLVAVAAPFSDQVTRKTIGRGGIYRSNDAGATWVETTAPNTNWTGIASSADGVKLVAVSASRLDLEVSDWIGLGEIYTSPDAGAAWKRTSAPALNWSCVASSADGTRLVAAVFATGENAYFGDESRGGLVYTSTDSGATWTATSAPNRFWSSVASSADGSRLAAGSVSDIYTSNDSGATWRATGTDSIGGLQAVACSADGYRLVAGGTWRPLCTWPYSGPWRLASAPSEDWSSIACSADGSKLLAISLQSALLYRSSDSGAGWTNSSAPTNAWSGIASSADGVKLVAVAAHDFSSPSLGTYGDGSIYRSLDEGSTWTRSSAPSNYWTSVASSADGTRLVAAATGFTLYGRDEVGQAGIYRSSDSGVNWIRTTAPTNDWQCVASSSDGTKLVAVGVGAIYRSVDSGITWIRSTAPDYLWSSVASSADGARMVVVAAASSGAIEETASTIYISSDSGATWKPTSATPGHWRGVASSANGAILLVVGSWDMASQIEPQMSMDFGATWTVPAAPAVWWSAVASSADANSLVLAGRNHIATLRRPAPAPPITPSPQLNVVRLNNNLALSWIVPSTPFVLQGTAGLGSIDWMTVPSTPTLNVTNLHYSLNLPLASAKNFYRLREQL